jgi:GNAT superfamily N-acetyltransferase
MILRPYEAGDEVKIVALFKTVFGKDMPLPYWHWRFGKGNPWGSSIVVAMDGDTMAAHYAVSHQPVTMFGRTFLGAQSMTTMTHPEYRKQGLFVRCATICYEMAKAAGCKFVYCFPNKNSAPTFYGALKWERLGRVGFKRNGATRCGVGSEDYQAYRWGEDFGPEYGGLLLDPEYRHELDALELHLEDSDTYTYERDCRRLTC